MSGNGGQPSVARKGVVRINLGGPDYTDSRGKRWEADRAYAPRGFGCANLPETDVLTTTDDIAGAADAPLFQSMRTAERMVYRFDVPNRAYTVRLLFAETYWETADAERQDIYLQGKRVLRDFNIFDDAGHDAALEKQFDVKVTSGTLEIRFEATSLPMHNGARACAIAVEPVPKTRKRTRRKDK